RGCRSGEFGEVARSRRRYACSISLPRVECEWVGHFDWVDRTRVPAAESMPPMPLTSPSLTFGTWRAPHSPRSCRTDSMMGKIPYMPECVYESPPPLVLMGSLPPGVDRPSSKKCTPSPGLQRPSDSSMIGGPEVKAS